MLQLWHALWHCNKRYSILRAKIWTKLKEELQCSTKECSAKLCAGGGAHLQASRRRWPVALALPSPPGQTCTHFAGSTSCGMLCGTACTCTTTSSPTSAPSSDKGGAAPASTTVSDHLASSCSPSWRSSPSPKVLGVVLAPSASRVSLAHETKPPVIWATPWAKKTLMKQ